MDEETHGTLLRDVKAWCSEHGAEFVSVGRAQSPYDRDASLWRAEVRFANGRSFTAHAPTQSAVIADLTHLGLVLQTCSDRR